MPVALSSSSKHVSSSRLSLERSKLHLHFFQRVEGASEGVPGYARALPAVTLQIFAVQVGFAPVFVPPTTFSHLGTVMIIRVVVVLIFGTELHAAVVRQRITFRPQHVNTSLFH